MGCSCGAASCMCLVLYTNDASQHAALQALCVSIVCVALLHACTQLPGNTQHFPDHSVVELCDCAGGACCWLFHQPH
jgi:hypothetical protein